MKHLLAKRPFGETGAVASEYALLVGFIAIVIVLGVGAYGRALGDFIQGLANQIRVYLGI